MLDVGVSIWTGTDAGGAGAPAAPLGANFTAVHFKSVSDGTNKLYLRTPNGRLGNGTTDQVNDSAVITGAFAVSTVEPADADTKDLFAIADTNFIVQKVSNTAADGNSLLKFVLRDSGGVVISQVQTNEGLRFSRSALDVLMFKFDMRRSWNPKRTGTLANNPFTTTNASAIVTVHHVAHGITAGVDKNGVSVEYSGATAVGGITISGLYSVLNVVDADNYRITHSAAATSGATGGGAAVAYVYGGGLELWLDDWDIAGSLTVSTWNWAPDGTKLVWLNRTANFCSFNGRAALTQGDPDIEAGLILFHTTDIDWRTEANRDAVFAGNLGDGSALYGVSSPNRPWICYHGNLAAWRDGSAEHGRTTGWSLVEGTGTALEAGGTPMVTQATLDALGVPILTHNELYGSGGSTPPLPTYNLAFLDECVRTADANKYVVAWGQKNNTGGGSIAYSEAALTSSPEYGTYVVEVTAGGGTTTPTFTVKRPSDLTSIGTFTLPSSFTTHSLNLVVTNSGTNFATGDRFYIHVGGYEFSNGNLNEGGKIFAVREAITTAPVTLGSNPLTTTNLSPIVTVAETSHGRTTGNEIIVGGTTAVGGITPLGRYKITVTGANAYTFVHTANATSGATGGGSAVTVAVPVAQSGLLTAAQLKHRDANSYRVAVENSSRENWNTAADRHINKHGGYRTPYHFGTMPYGNSATGETQWFWANGGMRLFHQSGKERRVVITAAGLGYLRPPAVTDLTIGAGSRGIYSANLNADGSIESISIVTVSSVSRTPGTTVTLTISGPRDTDGSDATAVLYIGGGSDKDWRNDQIGEECFVPPSVVEPYEFINQSGSAKGTLRAWVKPVPSTAHPTALYPTDDPIVGRRGTPMTWLDYVGQKFAAAKFDSYDLWNGQDFYYEQHSTLPWPDHGFSIQGVWCVTFMYGRNNQFGTAFYWEIDLEEDNGAAPRYEASTYHYQSDPPGSNQKRNAVRGSHADWFGTKIQKYGVPRRSAVNKSAFEMWIKRDYGSDAVQGVSGDGLTSRPAMIYPPHDVVDNTEDASLADSGNPTLRSMTSPADLTLMFDRFNAEPGYFIQATAFNNGGSWFGNFFMPHSQASKMYRDWHFVALYVPSTKADSTGIYASATHLYADRTT